MIDTILLAGYIITIIVAALHSAAEIAIAPVSRDSVERLIDNHVSGARIVYALMANRRRLYIMLLSGRILAFVTGTVLLYEIALRRSGYGGIPGIGAANIVVVACSTAMFILAEGLIAQLIAVIDFEKLIPRMAWFLFLFHIALYPVTWTLDHALSLFIKKSHEQTAKEEALIEMVKSEAEEGTLEDEEREMIEGVMEFFDTSVREVMVPRIDMIAVDKTITISDLVELFRKEGHSRIPVYDERIDNIVGVIYAKDMLPAIAAKAMDEIDITSIMRPAFYVPETKNISVLLKELKKAKVHLAIVVDEYGGTAGLVALEDLIEEIVGDIQDEYDRDERDYLWINDRTVLMDAGLDIDDVNDIINSEIPDEDFDTLGGFIYHQLGVIPKGGEEFMWENISFSIKEIDGNRISKVIVKLEEPVRNGDMHHEDEAGNAPGQTGQDNQASQA